MKDTAYYKSVLESLELGCEVEWNEIHWYNYWSSSGLQNWEQRYGIHLPNKLGLGNLHDSLYVEYWGWEYGLPEKSPPGRKHKKQACLETAEDREDDPVCLFYFVLEK